MSTTTNSLNWPITHFSVLTGGASNLINNVSPSATSGFPLVSQGSSSQPIFGTAVVAGGGTGLTSATAYSVLCGGTTSTGNFQSIASIGTTGQIFTSNGSSSLPSWQTAPSGSFAPNAVVNLFDDFVSNGGSSMSFGLNWSSGNFTAQPAAVSTNPGIVCNSSFSSGNAGITFSGASGIILGSGTITHNWVFNVNTLSTGTNRYTLRFGLTDTSNGDAANGVYFEYSDNINSGQWNIKTAAASSRTTNNSNISVVAGAWVNASIVVNAAANSVAYYINGTQINTSPITTTIPTLAIVPTFNLSRNAGTIPANSVYLDLFYLTQVLTTAR